MDIDEEQILIVIPAEEECSSAEIFAGNSAIAGFGRSSGFFYRIFYRCEDVAIYSPENSIKKQPDFPT